jgi:hypothetical protein
MGEEVHVYACEEMAEMSVCSVVEVGVCPAATKGDVASVADGGGTEFAFAAYGVEAEEVIEEVLHPRGKGG